MNDFSHPDSARMAEENPEFGEAYRELSEGLLSRRAAVAALESDPRAEARLKQAMVRWVEDDVAAEFRQTSLAMRLRRRLNSLAGTWRELVGNSVAFRLASRGALALGLGLILGFGVDLAGVESARASAESREAREAELPAVSRFRVDPSTVDREAERVRISRSRVPVEVLEGAEDR